MSTSKDFESLTAIVKAYDVRGVVDETLTEPIVEALGAAFVDEVDGAGASLVIGHDMRESSPRFAKAFARGAKARGANVVHLGLCSTDESYYASGALNAAAAMFTASHNPANYNGIKMSRPGARGISLDTGLAAIRDRAAEFLENGIDQVATPGTETSKDVLADYAAYLRGLVDLTRVRPLKVVVDAGNGMSGLTVPAVLQNAAGLGELPLEIVPLYFELDGTFPNHEANPLVPENIADLRRAVVEHAADIGLAFDGDADRCFVVDEKGEPMNPSAVAALVAVREIERAKRQNPDEPVTVIHNAITSDVVAESIEAAGATAVRSRVGHSLIKDLMKTTGAVFGGEHSAHYYFKDFWSADNGMLAALHVLAELGGGKTPLSALAAKYTPYYQSGEINSRISDIPAALTRVVEAFTGRGDFDELDGLTVRGNTGGDEAFWWFNVRASNTEPLLRLNIEAGDQQTMEAIRNEVVALIRA